MHQPPIQILILDDDPSLRSLLEEGLGAKGFEVEAHAEPKAALAAVARRAVELDLVLTDLELGAELDGLELSRRIGDLDPDLPVVLFTGFGTLEAAIEAVRAGIYDFVLKPVELGALEVVLRRAAERRRLIREVSKLRAQLARPQEDRRLLGESEAIRRVYDLIERVAATTTTILVTGESGTGKELVASEIHRLSGAEGAFVPVNCAAIAEHLLESELFGHTKGAFTGAHRDRRGLFLEAEGGTIFLDEIGEMPAEMQVKLLRALQERRVRPVGSDRDLPFTARVVAATNRDLAVEVEEGRFRQDLYYRINVINIAVPPLRQRGRDVLLLAQHFLERFAERMGREVKGISTEAAEKLLGYEWPGNVRELENCMERAVTLTLGEEVSLRDLPPVVREHEPTHLVLDADDPAAMPTMATVERRYVMRVLKVVNENKTRAAQILGLDRRTLYRKLERWEEERAAPEEEE